MFAKTSDDITIQSDPSGADVYLNLTKVCETPCTFPLPRKTFEIPEVTLRKEGYATASVEIQKTIETKALFNLGFITTSGGITSWGIDALTGAVIKYSPTGYYVELKSKTSQAGIEGGTLRHSATFALMASDDLKRDIARGDGEYLHAYYTLGFSDLNYPSFLERVKEHRQSLLKTDDGLTLDRAMKKIAGEKT